MNDNPKITIGTDVFKFVQYLEGAKNKAIERVRENLFEEIKTRIVRQHSYNYDFNEISLVEESPHQEFIASWIFQNNLPKRLMNIVFNASKNGYGAILLRVQKKQIYPQNIYLLQAPKIELDVLKEAFFSTESIDLKYYKNETFKYMKLFLNDNGKYELHYLQVNRVEDKENKYILANGKIQTQKNEKGKDEPQTFVYDTIDFCPLEILENNETSTPDWQYAIETMRLYAKFNSFIETEWEYMKFMLINNMEYNPTQTGEQIQQKIEAGEMRIFDSYDQDNRNAQALSYFTSGGVTIDILEKTKDKFKEEIKELTFHFGNMAGGNNKHTTEALAVHLDALKYLQIKKYFFTIFLQKLFFKVIKMTNASFKGKKLEQLDDASEVEVRVQLSRPLEILLNLNADSSEQDAETQKIIQENENGVEK